MPISILDIASEERSVSIPIGEETLNVTYQPGKYTPVVEETLRTMNERMRPGNGLAATLVQMVVKWDLLDENGEIIPIQFDRLRGLPVYFLTTVTNAITSDMRPGKNDRKNSGGGSQQKENRGSSLTGTS